MKKLFSLILIGVLLSGCSLMRTHKQDIDQGNIITEDNVSKLHRGMSEDQVEDIMGHPILMNTFSPNRMAYVYTYQAGYGQMTEKRVLCTFVNGRLSEISVYMPRQANDKKSS
jgi:outer membrane protein assembly factor BamE